ncbi:alpha/beta fold hydrolase [Myxococcota bacterium]|nr:alpha/beta fold hydrolase [Myxococcota bacterium]
MSGLNVDERHCELPSGLKADVLVKGEGPPLVFLHGHMGRRWDVFLDDLAQNHTVYAPRHPGATDPDELMKLDGFSDLVLYYDDLFQAFEIEQPILVGHSFGGMVAAEFAATYPQGVSALVLIASLGLWLDDQPVTDITGIASQQVPSTLSTNPDAENVRELFSLPADPAKIGDVVVERMSCLASVSHFVWPIPDRELVRRLYRVTPPTLLVWGSEDRFVPLAYAAEFAKGLPNARTSRVDGAGHFVQLDRLEEVTAAVNEFLPVGV